MDRGVGVNPDLRLLAGDLCDRGRSGGGAGGEGCAEG
jgi:hypothetical protein